MNSLTQPTIIVGAGFTGLFTALHLRHQHFEPPIILIDAQSRFVFKPMLYEFLTAELSEDTVCPAYQDLLTGSNIIFEQDRVVGIDLKQNQIQLASGKNYTFSRLVLAVGSIQGYLGTAGAEEHAYPFRSREDALALKQQLQSCLATAVQTINERQRQSLLTFAIVGAGPSGVEMAATLADLLPYWYAQQGGNIHEIQIVLLNHGEHILQGDVNAHLRETALRSFRTRTVPVVLKTGAGVKAVYADRLEFELSGRATPETLPTHTTIWTAGTATNPLIKTLAAQIPAEHLNKHGLPLVIPTLQLLDFPSVFVAGDCADVQDQHQPALAQVAYQQGTAIAHNLIALHKGNSLKPAHVNLRGTLMKLGLGNGVANLFDKLQIEGKPGDLIRSATYLEMLPTPLHDFKATTEWLKEETFHCYHKPKVALDAPLEPVLSPVEKRDRKFVKALAIVAPIVFLIAALIGLQTPPREQIRPTIPPNSTQPSP